MAPKINSSGHGWLLIASPKVNLKGLHLRPLVRSTRDAIEGLLRDLKVKLPTALVIGQRFLVIEKSRHAKLHLEAAYRSKSSFYPNSSASVLRYCATVRRASGHSWAKVANVPTVPGHRSLDGRLASTGIGLGGRRAASCLQPVDGRCLARVSESVRLGRRPGRKTDRRGLRR